MTGAETARPPRSQIPATVCPWTSPALRRSSSCSATWPRASTTPMPPGWPATTARSVRVQNKSSGAAEQLLANGWDESVEGPRPVIWVPRGLDVGAGTQPAPVRGGAAGDGAHRRRQLHAHAARHRHAPAHGRGARLARHTAWWADVLALARDGALAGARVATRSGAHSGSARPTRTSRPAGCRRSSHRPTPPPARPAGCRSKTSPTRRSGASPAVSSRPSCTTATPRSRSSTTGTGLTSAATPTSTSRRWPSRRSRSSTTTPATPTASSTRARSRGSPGSRSSPSIRRRAPSTATTR